MFGFLSTSTPAAPKVKHAHLLVIVPNKSFDFAALFKTTILPDGRPLKVVQALWEEINVWVDYCSGKPKCNVYTTFDKKTFTPDFCLVRSEVRGVEPDQDYRNKLFALMYGNVPSINSLLSVYCFLERPVVQAELVRLSLLHGKDLFPVVRQSYYPSHKEMMYGDEFPAVVKVGHAHSGYGKMRITDHHALEDMRSVLALSTAYNSVEPFLTASYDLRIQKIGENYRAWKRISISGNWKTNTGASHLEQVEFTDQYKLWITEASKAFGGLDVCTVDAIHDDSTDKDYIMEINGTSSGFHETTEEEDYEHLKLLILTKMNALYPDTL